MLAHAHLLLLTTILVTSQDDTAEWCYAGSCSPKTWKWNCSTGLMQSPININPTSATRAKPDRTLIFSAEFYDLRTFALENSGKAVKLGPYYDLNGITDAAELRVKGAGWNGTFEFVELSFHWGSEHMFKGQRFALEAQILFEQSNGSGAKGIVSILFASTKTPSKALAPIVSLLPRVTDITVGLPPRIDDFNLSTLFPNVWDVFRYSGSLTVPPCNQSVMWSVFTQKMPVSQEQVDAFAKVHDPNGLDLKRNFRPLQTILTKERKKIYWMKINRGKMIENKF